MKGKLRRSALLASALAALTIGTCGSVFAASNAEALAVAQAKAGVEPKARYLREQQSPETIAARQHLFGYDNVNPDTGAVRTDRVIMSYMGVSTFAASFNGHVVMLDGYLAFGRSGTWGSNVEYLHTSIQEYTQINPVAYIFGHGHGDHMGHATIILSYLPNLPMFGMEEHCNDIKTLMAPQPVDCTSILPAGAQFGSEATIPQRLFNIMSGVDLRAVKHPHSAGPLDPVNDPAFPTEQAVVRPCNSYSLYPPDGSEPPSIGGPTSGVLSFSWQFRVGNFALGWADTTGDISGTRPVPGLGTGAEVPPVYAHWPHTNVMFGSIAVSPRRIFNQQMAAIQPQVFTAIHHDPCSYDVKRAMDDQMKTLSDPTLSGGLPPVTTPPQLRWIDDPGAYATPIAFDPAAPFWN